MGFGFCIALFPIRKPKPCSAAPKSQTCALNIDIFILWRKQFGKHAPQLSVDLRHQAGFIVQLLLFFRHFSLCSPHWQLYD
jgi:hypothetical protein